MRAQKDTCGIGMNEEWETAVTKQFRQKYWPYVNALDPEVPKCVEKMFLDSLTNLSKSQARNLVV